MASRYTDDQIHAAVTGGAWDGIPKQTKTRWTREAEEWEAETRAAEREGRDPEPGGRVARVLQAARQLPAPADGSGPTEGTFSARARTREEFDLDAVRQLVGGRIAQLLDALFDDLDKMSMGQKRELLKDLFGEMRQLQPKPTAGEGAGGPMPTDPLVLALIGQNQQVNLGHRA